MGCDSAGTVKIDRGSYKILNNIKSLFLVGFICTTALVPGNSCF